MSKQKQDSAGGPLTAAAIAAMVEGELQGEGGLRVDGVGSLDEATPGKAAFLGHGKYRGRVLPSQASVVLVPADFAEPPPPGRAWVVCRNPSAAFNRLIEHFAVLPPPPPSGVNRRAAVAGNVRLPDSVSVGPCAVIESGVEIGENSVIGAGCYLGFGVRIGRDCRIYPNVSIREFCRLGDRVIVHCGAVIGSDGFGFVPGREGHGKIPQVGIVQIDDDVEVGASTAIDRARFGRTWIKRGVKIDNLVQIAHNVVIGEHSFVVAQVGIAGSTRLGRHVILAGQAGVAGHLEIGDGAAVLGQAGVNKDLPPGAKVVGSPAVGERDFVREKMNLARIDKLRRELRELKKEFEQWRQAESSDRRA